MFSQCGGRGPWLTSAIALAVSLSQGRSQEQLAQLGAFFTVVGDTLALFSLHPDQIPGCGSDRDVSPSDSL